MLRGARARRLWTAGRGRLLRAAADVQCSLCADRLLMAGRGGLLSSRPLLLRRRRHLPLLLRSCLGALLHHRRLRRHLGQSPRLRLRLRRPSPPRGRGLLGPRRGGRPARGRLDGGIPDHDLAGPPPCGRDLLEPHHRHRNVQGRLHSIFGQDGLQGGRRRQKPVAVVHTAPDAEDCDQRRGRCGDGPRGCHHLPDREGEGEVLSWGRGGRTRP
mmetsp:Transcript_78057/g.240967  ORF Transcript_78057/g.240967 Transcript_78057/m.240967 type:complete len:214 (-) Transcript_78057:14-655(-)